MPPSSFATVARRLHRQNIATFGSLVLALALAGMLALGGQHAIEQERARLTADFGHRVEYLLEQEQFLRQLHDQNARQQRLPEPLPADVRHPFDFVPAIDGGAITPAHAAIGTYLSRQYSAFWAFSYFPAAPLMVVNGSDGGAVLVPGQADNGPAPTVPAWLRRARALALQEGPRLPGATPAGSAGGPAITPVRWFALPGQPGMMLGLAHAGFRTGRVPAITDDASQAYMALVSGVPRPLPRDRAPVLPEQPFWLERAGQGQVLGSGTPPHAAQDGFSLDAQGLVLRLRDRSGDWTGTYRIGYGGFFEDNAWLLGVALALFALAVLGGIGYVRWYRLRVIEPARRAQAAIVESEAFNRTLIETVPVALCVVTRSGGQVLFATALARDWLGLVAEQPMPMPPADAQAWRRMLDATAPGAIERIDLDDGRSLHMAYAPTRYQRRDVVLCAFTDVSTHAQEQRALARARAAADEASAAKSTFLATMSHEIRTPLYGLLGTLELLALTRLDGQQAQHVARLQVASRQLLQQISDILDISRIEAGQMQVESAPFSPREVVQQCTASYVAMAGQSGLLLFCTIGRDVPGCIRGDAERVRQVLSNLISNALKFTPAGHVIVRLQRLRREDGSDALQFQVADSGTGIPADKLDQLFTPFNAINQRPHTVRGSGLGLSICQRLAGLMGGAMSVASEVGLGSRFSLELPLVDAAPAAAPEPAPCLAGMRLLLRSPHPELSRHLRDWLGHWGADVEIVEVGGTLPLDDGRLLLDVRMPAAGDWHGRHLRLSPQEGAASHPEIDGCSVDSIARGLQRLRQRLPSPPPAAAPAPLALDVLVAEDNPINQATLYDQLQQLGCRVSVAADGEQALAQWNARPCDVVLTDINMPRMNGYELARALRTQGARCAIVGVTANAMRDEEQRCLDSGMDAWLVKPIDLDHLHRLLRRWQPATAEPGPASAPPPAPPAIPEKYRQVFRTTMRVDIDRCREGITGADAVLVKQKLHRMRGALVTVGQGAFAQALEEAEHRLAREDWSAPLGEDLLALCLALDNLVAGA